MRRFWLEGLALIAVLATALGAANASSTRAAQPIKQLTDWRLVESRLDRKHSFALVIGISEFDNLPHLSGVDDEVALVRDAFDRHGFAVDPPFKGRMTKKQLKKEIVGFLDRYGKSPENRLVIYVATHGYAAQDRAPYGFLLASDTLRPEATGFEESAFSVNELSLALTGINAQHIFLFFNACFSGAMVPNPERGTALDAAVQEFKKRSPAVERWTLDLLQHNARLVLTAGSDGQTVPDVNNPYARALVAGLTGLADADGDGLILGTELAQFVRGRVARETRASGKPNDAVFAILPKKGRPAVERPDVPSDISYGLQGDFIFLTPEAERSNLAERQDNAAEILAARANRLKSGEFVECADCPVMVEMPDSKIALGETEVTYAQWDACYREFGCRRFLPDDGDGRGDRPAGGMTWQDVQEFRAWLDVKSGDHCKSYRIPRRSEWLTAARRDAVEVSRTAELGKAICRGCGPGRDEGRALAVASLPSDALGLYDLSGNVWEWVEEDDGPTCHVDQLMSGDTCEDGTVMGGSFATSADVLSPELEGHLPRTSNEWPWSWPTVGLRVACDMK